MCGRIEYHITSRKKLEDRYGATLVEGWTAQGQVNARYNITPQSLVPVVTSEDRESIKPAHWGFLPSWAKKGVNKEVINARAETVLEKPYFKNAIRARRCLVPVTGFYEWHREGTTKTPYRFYTDDEIFSLGGLYTPHGDGESARPYFALITTEANSVMAPVHERMPVIVPREHEDSWLNPDLSDEELAMHFKPFTAQQTHAYEISKLVNNPRNDSPEVIEPVTAQK